MARKHLCPYCGRSFDRVDRLAQHILHTHKNKIKRPPKSKNKSA